MILLPRLLLTAFFAVMAAPSLALACSNPSGDAGDQIYNTTHNVMQYCNGTAWVAMGTSGAMVGDSLGNHAASEDLHMNGFKIIGLGAPLDGTDAASKSYVDLAVTSNIPGLSAVLSAGSAAGGTKITNLGEPTDGADAATKQYVDTNKVDKAGDTMTGHLSAPVPTADNHVATRGYVNSVLASASGGGGGGFATCYYAQESCTPPFNQMASSHRNDGVDHVICCYVDLGATQNPVGAFGFQDLVSVGMGTTVMSDIQQVTDVTGLATASISGQGLPEFRICYDSNCGSVLSGWAASTRNVQNNLYIQMRTTAHSSVSSEHNVTMNIGAGTDLWSVMTAPNFTTSGSVSPVTGAQAQPILFDHNYTVGVTGDSAAQVRICSTANCSAVVHNWTTGTASLSAGQYAQLGMEGVGSRDYTAASLTLDNVSHGTWTPTFNLGYFVATYQTFNGNLGGLTGADSTCLSQLTTYDWQGKAEAVSRGLLVAGKVKAFLCDGSTCNNPVANTAYSFARAGDVAAGGARLYTNASGRGPNDTTSWNGSTYFNLSNYIWSNRAAGTSTLWGTTPAVTGSVTTNCSGFTHATNAQNAIAGYVSTVDGRRWNHTAYGCATGRYLVCMVHP